MLWLPILVPWWFFFFFFFFFFTGQQHQEGLVRNPGSSESSRPLAAPSRSFILSSILRGPLPNPRAPHPGPVSIAVEQNQQAFPKTSGYRSVSPVRVITASTIGGHQQPTDPKSLSPSRTPTTLPPKKSLSPSRTVYTDRQSPQQIQQRLHQASPPQRGHNLPSRGPTEFRTQTIQLPRSSQNEIPQTLLQQLHVPAEALFQQYKLATATDASATKEVHKGVLPEGLTRDMIALAEQAVNSAPRVPTQVRSMS